MRLIRAAKLAFLLLCENAVVWWPLIIIILLFVSSVVVTVVYVVVLFCYQSMFCVFNKSNLESIY